jgi:hypothetical protein
LDEKRKPAASHKRFLPNGIPRNQFDTGLPSFHPLTIDERTKQRYSDPINGADLVQIANPMLQLPHPMNVAPNPLYSVLRFPTTHLQTVAVPAADLGGYFSA